MQVLDLQNELKLEKGEVTFCGLAWREKIPNLYEPDENNPTKQADTSDSTTDCMCVAITTEKQLQLQ